MSKKLGFTFLEILIALVVILLLASIALPSYRERKRIANEDGAAQVMLKDAQFLEQWHTLTGTYRNKKTGKLPTLPYRLYPESADIEPLYYIFAEIPQDNANRFWIKAQPICGRLQEGRQFICIDEHSNVFKHANKSCSNSNDDAPCIDPDKIPKPDDNEIDDTNNQGGEEGELKPDDPEDINKWCATNPNSKECECSKRYSKTIEIKKCACDAGSKNDLCPNGDDDIDYKCRFNRTLPECTDWDFCQDKLNSSNYPQCTCDVEAFKVESACKVIPPKPTPTPDPDPTNIDPYDVNSEAKDTCGNVYKCKVKELCNCQAISKEECAKYSPGGTEYEKAWQMAICDVFGKPSDYNPDNNYKKGDMIVSRNCIQYYCNESQAGLCKQQTPGSGDAWISFYQGAGIFGGKSYICKQEYKVNDLAYINGRLYICVDANPNSCSNTPPGSNYNVWKIY